MRVALFDPDRDGTLPDALRAEGLEVGALDLPVPGSGATAALAAGFRDAEGALAADPPAAVVVAGEGDEALAVAITAVKLEVPVVWLAPDEPEGLVGRVADRTVDASAGAVAIAAAIRESAAPTIPAP
jgi:hypothetical protein